MRRSRRRRDGSRRSSRAGPRTKGWFWFWAAEALPALDLYLKTNDARYLEYARAIVGFMENSAARTPDGAFVPHPPALEVWIDVCYFTAPALALLGRISRDEAMIERAADQMNLHRDHLIDPDSGLFWHVAYVDRKSHSPCLWARGNSWFSIAAPQVMAEIEAAGAARALGTKTEKFRATLARQLNRVAALQDESGLWHTVIDRDDSYLESSSAAGFALAFGRALRTRLPGLDEARARDGVLARARRDLFEDRRARRIHRRVAANAAGRLCLLQFNRNRDRAVRDRRVHDGAQRGAWDGDMPNKKVVVLPGDDAAPEAMGATMDALRALKLPIDYIEFPPGEKWVRGETDAAARKAIDASDTTLFGSTSGKTTSITYLRWGKQTFANVRPVRYSKGFHSPLAKPDGIDFVIVRENLEDLYLGLEGPLEALAPLKLMSKILRAPLDTSERGIYAIKVITERATRRVAEFACQLAVKRKHAGGKGKLTCTSKYNMLRESDGLFRKVVEETAARYPEIKYEQFIVDDFARRLVQSPHELDVVVAPNLYGDILSDAAAGIIGGLGLAPSGCYGADYAYFESVHGTAPDIMGQGIINPSATMMSAALMLDYLGFSAEASRFDAAVRKVYAEGRVLTPDQGGTAKTSEFTRAVIANL